MPHYTLKFYNKLGFIVFIADVGFCIDMSLSAGSDIACLG